MSERILEKCSNCYRNTPETSGGDTCLLSNNQAVNCLGSFKSYEERLLRIREYFSKLRRS